MINRKSLWELTIKDNFMFTAVMSKPENAKAVLECILGIEVDHVEVEYEKTILYNPEYKGVRLDVYVKDGAGRYFNVEMQTTNESVYKRSRYYHSQIDVELIESGISYDKLPDSYVIFICDFDPVGLGKYKYTIKKSLSEEDTYAYDDGSYTVLLNTKGQNEGEEPEELVSFLKYVGAAYEESNSDYKDELVDRLQKSVNTIKTDREMRARYMLWEEIKKKEFREGKAEGKAEAMSTTVKSIVEILSKLGPVNNELVERIMNVDALEELNRILVCAAGAKSIKEFAEKLDSFGF